MANVVDLKKTVFEVVQEHPEVADILVGVGLTAIKDPGVLEGHGKETTIPKGVSKKGLPLEVVIKALEAAGFQVQE